MADKNLDAQYLEKIIKQRDQSDRDAMIKDPMLRAMVKSPGSVIPDMKGMVDRIAEKLRIGEPEIKRLTPEGYQPSPIKRGEPGKTTFDEPMPSHKTGLEIPREPAPSPSASVQPAPLPSHVPGTPEDRMVSTMEGVEEYRKKYLTEPESGIMTGKQKPPEPSLREAAKLTGKGLQISAHHLGKFIQNSWKFMGDASELLGLDRSAIDYVENRIALAQREIEPNDPEYAYKFFHHLFLGVGQAMGDVAKYGTGTKFFGNAVAAMAIIDGITAYDQGAKATALAALRGAGLGEILHLAGPMKLAYRMPFTGAVFGGMAAAGSEDTNQVLASGFTGALLGALGGKGSKSPKEAINIFAKGVPVPEHPLLEYSQVGEAHLREMFPNVPMEKTPEGAFVLRFPEGPLTVTQEGEASLEGVQLTAEQKSAVEEGAVVAGEYEASQGEDFMRFAQSGDMGTLKHETMHYFIAKYGTPSEIQTLLREGYARGAKDAGEAEEIASDLMRKHEIRMPTSIVSKAYQEISRALGTAESIRTRIRTGEALTKGPPEGRQVLLEQETISPKDKASIYTIGEQRAILERKAQDLGVGEEEIDRWFKATDLTKSILSSRPDLLPEVEGKEPIKENADFFRSGDLDTVCPRRERYGATVAGIEKGIGRMLTPKELVDVARMMRDQGFTFPCLYCYVESNRGKAQSAIKSKASELGVPEKVLVDADYRKKWTKGDEKKEALVDEALGHGAKQQVNLPKGYSEYTAQILRWADETVNKLNKRAGLRFFSNTDFKPEHMLDLMQMIIDMSARKLKGHAYTKQPDFVEVFAPTGLKINMSIAANGNDQKSITMDADNGMDWNTAFKLSKKFPQSAGVILMAKNDAQIEWGLNNPKVGMIIPYHRSNLEKGVRMEEGLTDYTYANREKFAQWKDHPNYQKLLTDVASWGEGKDHAPVTPDWNVRKAAEVIRRWQAEGGTEKEAIPSVVKESVDQLSGGKKKYEVRKDETEEILGKQFPKEFEGFTLDGQFGDADFVQYTDHRTDSETARMTFYVKDPADLPGKLAEKRQEFGLEDVAEEEFDDYDRAYGPQAKYFRDRDRKYEIKKDRLGMYSQMEKVVADRFPKTVMANQIIPLLKKFGVKEAEIRDVARNLLYFGGEKLRVSKEDLLSDIQARAIRIHEVVRSEESANYNPLAEFSIRSYGTPGDFDYTAPVKEADGRSSWITLVPPDSPVIKGTRRATPEEWNAILKFENFEESGGGKPKYEDKTLPGGTNYREITLTLPTPIGKIRDFNTWINETQGLYPEEYGETALENLRKEYEGLVENKDPSVWTQPRDATIYRDPHWEEGNVIANMLINDRVTREGKRVLNVEEMQSEWDKELRTSKDAPPMPFSGDWKELVAKRVITMAVEQGYEGITWKTGKEVAGQYDLTKHIAEIGYEFDGVNGYELVIVTPDGGEYVEGSDSEGLSNIVGKDLADKIISGKGEGRKEDPYKWISGLDLKIGGEWATHLYDKMFPSIFNKIAKRWGGKTDIIRLPVTTSPAEYLANRRDVHAEAGNPLLSEITGMLIDRRVYTVEQLDNVWPTVRSKYAFTKDESKSNYTYFKGVVESIPKEGEWIQFHHLEIPEAMRESVGKEGLPRYELRRPDETHFFSGLGKMAHLKGGIASKGNVGISLFKGEYSAPLLAEVEKSTTKNAVFVDSGAFTAFTKNRPYMEADWARVFGLYDQMVKNSSDPSKLFLSAPDVIGKMNETADLQLQHLGKMKEWSDAGIQLIVPIQRGWKPDQYIQHLNKLKDGLGKDFIVGFASNKMAWEPEQAASVIREVKPKRVHLLGLGPGGRRFPDFQKAIKEAYPDVEIYTDSVPSGFRDFSVNRMAKANRAEFEDMWRGYDETELYRDALDDLSPKGARRLGEEFGIEYLGIPIDEFVKDVQEGNLGDSDKYGALMTEPYSSIFDRALRQIAIEDTGKDVSMFRSAATREHINALVSRYSRGEVRFPGPEGIRLDKLYDLSNPDVMVKVKDMITADWENIDEARRGKVTLEEGFATARKMIETGQFSFQKFLHHKVGTNWPTPEHGIAARMYASKALLDFGQTQIAYERGMVSQETRDSMLAVAEASARVAFGGTAETGRTLAFYRGDVPGTERTWTSGEIAGISRFMENLRASGKNTDEVASALVKLSPRQLAQLSADLEPPGAWDMFTEIWINNLLSNPATHTANGLSNLIVLTGLVTERQIAGGNRALANSVRRAFGGREVSGVELGEAGAMVHALLEGVADSMRLAGKAFMTGESQYGTGKVDVPQEALTARNVKELANSYSEKLSGKKPFDPNDIGWIGRSFDWIADWLIRGPGKGLLAGDEFFKSINYRMEIAALAHRGAVRGEGEGETIADRYQFLKDRPTPDMKAQAMDFARYATFTDKGGKFTSAVMGIRESHPWARLVIPFVRTPSRIAHFSFQRMPLINALSKEIRSDLFGEDPVRRDLAMAKISSSALIAATVAGLVSAGMVTGGGPRDRQMKELYKAQGWMPYAGRIPGTDTWVTYDRLDPVGAMVAVIADYVELRASMNPDEENSDIDSIPVAIALALSSAFVSKTYMQGLSNAVESLTSADRNAGRYIRGLAGSAIPSFVGAFNRNLFDQHIREIETKMDAIRSRVPGYSTELPPRRDPWGNPSLSHGWAMGIILPFRVSKMESDPASMELINLGISTPRMSKYFGGSEPPALESVQRYFIKDQRKYGQKWSNEEYDELMRAYGNGLKIDWTGMGPDIKGFDAKKGYGMHDYLNAIVQDKVDLPVMLTLPDGKQAKKYSQLPPATPGVPGEDMRAIILRSIMNAYKDMTLNWYLQYQARKSKEEGVPSMLEFKIRKEGEKAVRRGASPKEVQRSIKGMIPQIGR